MINYKGFIGHFFFDATTNRFCGTVANSHDLITFQGASVAQTQQAFRDAVDQHIEWCKKHGKKFEVFSPRDKGATK